MTAAEAQSNTDFLLPETITEGPSKFEEYIVKVESRCNLACSYCFMYEHADQSWRDQPIMMDQKTLVQSAIRIAEHTAGETPVTVIFHGGEPLLVDKVNPKYYPWATAMMRNIIGSHVQFNMQTNGTLITDEVLDRMAASDISMGVSIDGLPSQHDAQRTYRNGNGSYWQVRRGIRMLAEKERRERVGIYGGLLMVISDPTTNPLHTYHTLTQHSYNPPNIDFLLPLAHHDMPPPGYTDDRTRTPYADWLIPIFDEYRRTQPRHSIRFLDAISGLGIGVKGTVEYLGLAPPKNIVIETNGEIQQADALKTVADGEPSLGLDVFNNTFDDAVRHPKTVQRQLGLAALTQECQDCDLVKVCGGGYQGHRYSAENGYNNMSVYHPDLKKIINYVIHADRERAFAAALDALAVPISV